MHLLNIEESFWTLAEARKASPIASSDSTYATRHHLRYKPQPQHPTRRYQTFATLGSRWTFWKLKVVTPPRTPLAVYLWTRRVSREVMARYRPLDRLLGDTTPTRTPRRPDAMTPLPQLYFTALNTRSYDLDYIFFFFLNPHSRLFLQFSYTKREIDRNNSIPMLW